MSAFVVAFTAVNRTVHGRTERYFGVFAAFGTDSVEHFTTGCSTVHACFAGSAAGRATTGLVGETLFSVEFLLGSGKNEIVTAFCTV